MSDRKRRVTGIVLTLLAACSAASAYLFASRAVDHMSPALLGLLEFSIASVPAVLWATAEGALREVRNLSRRVWILLLGQCLCTFGAIYTIWTGLLFVDPTTASLINRVEIVFTVVLSVMLFKERFSRWELVAGAVAFVGVVVLRWNAPPQLAVGSIWILASSLCFAAAEILAKMLAPELRSSVFLLVRTPIMALMFLVFVAARSLYFQRLPEVPSAFGVSMAAGLALSGPILARAFYFASLRRIPLSLAALLNQTQPLFVALLVAAVLQTLPGLRQYAGGALILGGSLAIIAIRLSTAEESSGR